MSEFLFHPKMVGVWQQVLLSKCYLSKWPNPGSRTLSINPASASRWQWAMGCVTLCFLHCKPTCLLRDGRHPSGKGVRMIQHMKITFNKHYSMLKQANINHLELLPEQQGWDKLRDNCSVCPNNCNRFHYQPLQIVQKAIMQLGEMLLKKRNCWPMSRRIHLWHG